MSIVKRPEQEDTQRILARPQSLLLRARLLNEVGMVSM
jgi:hypothetical protein